MELAEESSRSLVLFLVQNQGKNLAQDLETVALAQDEGETIEEMYGSHNLVFERMQGNKLLLFLIIVFCHGRSLSSSLELKH